MQKNVSKITYAVIVLALGDRRGIPTIVKKRGPPSIVGRLNFPGGRVDPEDLASDPDSCLPPDVAETLLWGLETHRRAAARELAEETGIVCVTDDLVHRGWIKTSTWRVSIWVLPSRAQRMTAARRRSEDEDLLWLAPSALRVRDRIGIDPVPNVPGLFALLVDDPRAMVTLEYTSA